MTNVALGIDWHKRSWVGVVLRPSTPPMVLTGKDLGELVDRVSDASCIGVDMPIGLPATVRVADAMRGRTLDAAEVACS